MRDIDIRALRENDRGWVSSLTREKWGSSIVVSRGTVHYPDLLPGFIAVVNGARQGLATFRISGDECEIVTLNALIEGQGVGSRLIEAVCEVASQAGCKRVWLVTTNDNVEAIRFYQKRGFELVAVHRNAVMQSRKLKPEIPLIARNGIPIRDEVELELPLQDAGA